MNTRYSYNVGLNRYEDEQGFEVDPSTGKRVKTAQDFLAAAEGMATPSAANAGLGPAYGAAVEDTRMYKILEPGSNRYITSPTPFPISDYRQAAVDIVEEILSARKAHGPIASAHEGYAIMLEEMDEVKEHVWMKQKNRDQAKLRKELVQLAAMAVAMIVEIADADNRR